MNKPILYISIGALIAFLLSAIIVSSLNLVNETSNNGTSMMVEGGTAGSLFTTQSASFEGTITDLKDNMVTLKTANNATDKFSLSQTVQITKFESGKTQPVVTTNQTNIELNKNVSIILNMVNGKYEVVNITYMPERVEPIVPPATKTSSASAKPAN